MSERFENGFTGRVAVVTGGGTGMGRELTNQLTTHAGAAASDDGNSSGESIFKTFAHESLHF